MIQQKYLTCLTIIVIVLVILYFSGFINIKIFENYGNDHETGHLNTFGPGKKPHSIRINPNKFPKVKDIAKISSEVPPPLNRTTPTQVNITLTTVEVISEIAPGISYHYWTFNKTVPGPFLRVLQNDIVNITIKNTKNNSHNHSIDLHASWAPGGGAGPLSPVGEIKPGESKSFQFKALIPGLYVYHCASPNVPTHIANGLYGMILVEPSGGLSKVDKEFYIVQGELYTKGGIGEKGYQEFDPQKMIDEKPEYIVFNGRTGALKDHALQAKVGDKVRIYFGNMGNTKISSFHAIGAIFDKVYSEGSLTSIKTGVQTTLVPAGGTTIVEMTMRVPGTFVLVDHALARIERGAWGLLTVKGNDQPSIFKSTILKKK
jgi:nitrite reductase (NO-forming)